MSNITLSSTSNPNPCSKIITCIRKAFEHTNRQIVMYNTSRFFEPRECAEFVKLTESFRSEGITVCGKSSFPKSEIGVCYNDQTKIISIHPISELRYSEK